MSITIKELFDKAENGVLTYDQFENAVKESGAKFADLSDGKYVSKSKYDSDLKAKDAQIESINEQIGTLNQTIATRDEDLGNLQKQLEAAGQDATKLAELNTQFSALQQQYDNDVKEYQSKMQKQAYEFAVKEFANTKTFSSKAAKRDFVKAMIASNLQMDGDKILGREDFLEKYSADNEDAFVVEVPLPDPEPIPEPAPEPEAKKAIPEIVLPTPGPEPARDNEFHFSFQGIHGQVET